MINNILAKYVLASVVTLFPALARAADTTIVVSPGSEEVLMDAVRQAREFKRMHSTADGYQFYHNNKDYPRVTLHLKAGTYRLYEPLTLRPEDSNLIIEGEAGTKIVGSVSIGGWKPSEAVKDAYEAPVRRFNGIYPMFRQLWIGSRKAVLARDIIDEEQMPRIINYDKQRRELWVPASTVQKLKPGTLEIVLHQMWEISFLRVKNIRVVGDSAAVTFCNPESRIQFSHPWPGPMYHSKHDSPFFLRNDLSLLDTPGEWFHDTDKHLLYYIPQTDAELQDAHVEAPILETLVKVEGTAERPVRNVEFRGVSFAYTTWLRPSFEGHVPLQAGMYLTEAYKLRPQIDRTDNHKLDNQGWLGRPRAAIEVKWGQSVDFTDCSFEHLGGSGVDYLVGCLGGTTKGCRFDDIAQNGYVSGSFSPEGHETHLPYSPEDSRVVCDSQRVANNVFTDNGNEDWGCCAIAAGYVSRILIEHNTIHHVPYSGISLGWGWNRTPNCMHDNTVRANLVYDYATRVYDCAGIYTLGNQPGTVIEENVVRDIARPSYVHDPEHWFYLYTDEGSSNITLRNNWTPTEKYLKNAVGPGNVWENNGPKVDAAVKRRAGVRQTLKQ